MAGPAPAAGEGPPPLAGGKLAVIAIALAVGTFMQVLDSTIANVSLPTIAGNLGVSSDNSTWVITAFAVANGIGVPLTGFLMGRFGVVRTFCLSVLLFTIASFLCGIAWNLSSLIFFRVLQGAVSGPMMPGSQALLISIFAADRRSTALGIWSMTTLVAPIMGPILGGYISDNYHWSWIFLINVPFGLICASLCWRGLKDRETPTRKLPIDKVGLFLLVLWVGSLQCMLDLGKNDDWFQSPRIVVFGVIAVVGAIAWIIWEMTDANPIVDLSLFKSRNFTIGAVAFCLGYAVFFANTLLLPLWLQTQIGYTATWAGLVAAPSGVVAVLLTPFVARMSGKIDARWLATVAFVSFAASYWMRSLLTANASFGQIMLPVLVQGVAMSTFFLAMLTISLDRIPAQRLPSATGLSNFTRIVAGSFAASIITTAWDRREALHQSRLSEAIGQGVPWQMARDGLAKLGLNETQAAAAVTRQMVGQAYLLASTDLFRLSAWLCAVMIPIVWFTRRPNAPSGPIAAD
ncbi:DHA2 family multidrug resistance protein [Sphingomonas sp. SORGH_AS802]|uniref:DHA2 family efflux MFS transporter permease subunit n=1 Tax=unclassified Sphingomonas TaxID=196159 RepID=UPI00285A4709|nr:MULTISPECIES: DHA2 family efflux MFS transporter permease subunit [unclassified Sphingomonas]MDR6126869.1 DHA2 family multidrug resistance protein [Sphingomonas sp. SORGH_AS_0438]MDR6134769.1 DHA2 family multidrug resistance protein [Sphingomonas sp. SORGH_AS_0802]